MSNQRLICLDCGNDDKFIANVKEYKEWIVNSHGEYEETVVGSEEIGSKDFKSCHSCESFNIKEAFSSEIAKIKIKFLHLKNKQTFKENL